MRKYTEAEFCNVVANSTSIRQALKALQLKPAGGNYQAFNKLVKKLNLDISHFTGQGWNKGKSIGAKRPITDYLSNQQTIGSHALKKRLLKEALFDYKCYQCGLTKWNGKPIPLELEHIDGNHINNNIDNLTLLCPNCHAQTTTYRGKNKRSS